MASNTVWECETCDFWYVLHGNPMNHDYSEERFQKCQTCNKPKRLEAYKSFWAERSKQ